MTDVQSDVRIDDRDQVRTITIDRPRSRNGLSRDSAEGITAFLQKRDPRFEGK
jgi:enoyl-CoA hydratase/carnithine racemase